jgi:hypothetical protein
MRNEQSYESDDTVEHRRLLLFILMPHIQVYNSMNGLTIKHMLLMLVLVMSFMITLAITTVV